MKKERKLTRVEKAKLLDGGLEALTPDQFKAFRLYHEGYVRGANAERQAFIDSIRDQMVGFSKAPEVVQKTFETMVLAVLTAIGLETEWRAALRNEEVVGIAVSSGEEPFEAWVAQGAPTEIHWPEYQVS